jgi:AcrR family transcriptional regulator
VGTLATVPPDRRQAILDAAIAVIARAGVRGLRVEQVASEAGVAVSLIYYYFGNRSGLVRATLEHANERAAATAPGDSVEAILMAELDESAHDTSVVWNEVLASAVFEPALRDGLVAASGTWSDAVARAIDGGSPAARDIADRLTALVDGLSARWLAGVITRERARELLAGAIAAELPTH